MTTIQNSKIIISTISVPVLFSCSLMLAGVLSIPPFFLENQKLTYGMFGSTLAALIITIFLKLDKLSWKEHFLKNDKYTLTRFLIGGISGLTLASCMFLIQAWYSGLEISITGESIDQFLILSISIIPLALMEELAFRSYPFFKLKQSYGIWTAQFAIAILFGLYHYIGGWTLLASFMGPFVWSFAFGLLALKSGGVASPTGFHYGLNLALAIIGSKHWIPGLVTIDFASKPTEKMLRSNEYFGVSLQLIVFIVLLAFTYRYSKKENE